jgi:hypothetical protein
MVVVVNFVYCAKLEFEIEYDSWEGTVYNEKNLRFLDSCRDDTTLAYNRVLRCDVLVSKISCGM